MDRTRREFLCVTGSLALFSGHVRAAPGPPTDAYHFVGSIPKTVLANYLARSISMPGFWSQQQNAVEDPSQQYFSNLRMLKDIGPKHVAFACDLSWNLGVGYDVNAVTAAGKNVADDLHAIDRDIIVGGACYETVGPAANTVRIPAWVFHEMGLPYESRTFRWEPMVYPETLAIDIAQLESRMWYYYWSRHYIDLGLEHMHFGDLDSLTKNDGPTFAHYRDLLTRVRKYAARRARRGVIVISVRDPAADRFGEPGCESSDNVGEEG